MMNSAPPHDDFTSVARVDWGVPDDGTIEMQQSTTTSSTSVVPVKLEGGEALVGNFADAAAAMR